MAPVRQNIASGVPMLLCRYEEQLVVTSSITLATAQQVCTSCHPSVTQPVPAVRFFIEHVPSLLPSDKI